MVTLSIGVAVPNESIVLVLAFLFTTYCRQKEVRLDPCLKRSFFLRVSSVSFPAAVLRSPRVLREAAAAECACCVTYFFYAVHCPGSLQ